MRYQVSCNMTFDKKADRNAVHAFLCSKYDLAYTVEDGSDGDYVKPDSIMQAVKQKEGPYTVECLLRFENKNDRDEIYVELFEIMKACSEGIPGFIEHHTCGHDEGLPCTNVVRNEWGVIDDGKG